MTVEELLKEAKAIQPNLEEIRRDLHQHPELGFELTYTKKLVIEKLREMGYQPQEVGKAGVVALTGGKNPGPCILLRADMDALPLTEDNDLSFKSQNQNRMHACGHDMHTAMLLGAAKILKDHESEIDGYVKLEFQPAEEIFQGSKDMIENGLLDNPPVDAAMMIHVMTGLPIKSGTVLYTEGGIISASHEKYTITVTGKGGHGSTPFAAIDPITAAAYIHIALGDIKARQLNPKDYGVFSTGIFKSGEAPNIIPEKAVMSGTIRTLDPSGKINEDIKERIKYISEHIGEAMRCKVDVEFADYCPCMDLNKNLNQSLEKHLIELAGDKAEIIEGGGNGSEDFAFVSQKVPAAAFYLAAGDSREGFRAGIHSPQAKFDDSVLYMGTAVFVQLALNWLKENREA